MRPKTAFVLGGVCLGMLLCVAGEAKDKPEEKTIIVDCSKGDSINQALKDTAAVLTIEISGMCQENVVVERNNVTLRGSDPAIDGIQAESEEEAALLIAHVGGIKFENLRFTGGRNGLEVDHSIVSWAVEVLNCEFTDNISAGADVIGSLVSVTDSSFRDNHDYGLWVHLGSAVMCRGCTVTGSNEGIEVVNSHVSLRDSHVTENAMGVLCIGSWVLGGGTNTITATQEAITAINGGRVGARADTVVGSVRSFSGSAVDLGAANLAGSLEAGEGGVIRMNGLTQIDNPDSNRVSFNSILGVDNSTLIGTTTLSDFGKASIKGSTVGDLVCESGGDAYCDDPSSTVSGTSNCGQCPKP